jgi:hypothetical protein
MEVRYANQCRGSATHPETLHSGRCHPYLMRAGLGRL